ncbi:DNA polymerase I [Dermabacteraceae bacterium P13103]
MASSDATYLLIDGHAMAFRAFYALPPEAFTLPTGEATNAVYGFASMMFNLIEKHQPSHVAVAFDLSGPTFRDEIYPAYKDGRDATPEAFKGQIDRIKTMLDSLGVKWLTAEGFEADDIVATLAQRAEDEDARALICTSDRDAFQLISERVSVLKPVKGLSELEPLTPADIVAKYDVTPQQYPELAALVGEKADNLPGVAGVGPKTAAKWLKQFGGLDALLERAEEVKGKAGQSLRDNLELVRRNRRMNQAVRNVPLPAADLRLRPVRAAAVQEVFDALAFGDTIRGRVPAALVEGGSLAAAEEKPQELPALNILRASSLADFTAPQSAAVLLESSLLALAEDTEVQVIDLGAAPKELRESLLAWFADAEAEKLFFDAKETQHRLRRALGEGFTLAGAAMDLSLAEFLCRPDSRPGTLDSLALRHLRCELAEQGSSEGQLLLDDAAESEALARRAWAIWALTPLLREELTQRHALSLLETLELPLAGVLARIEAEGIAVSRARLDEIDAEHAGKQTQAAQSAYAELDGEQINLNSPKQLQEVLFTRLEMPKTRKTRTGYTTDADALTELYAKTQHPFLRALLDYREVTKQRQIIGSLQSAVAEDERIHTTLLQNMAATGRLSSKNPNLQNIPARSEVGRRIRSAFRTREGFAGLMTADYSQIEMRIMAHLSGDEGLIEAFRSGEDLHVFVASRVFGVGSDEVDVEMRAKTKAVSYGLAYGLSAFGLSKQLHIPQFEATALRDGYFERFGGVRDFLAGVVERARENGYTETVLGRRRYLPDLTSDNRMRRENAERAALNSPIQGSAADIIKLAMLGVDRALREGDYASRLVLQVHDELIVDVAAGEEEAVREILVREMSSAYELSVPLDVSVGFGETWLAAAH